MAILFAAVADDDTGATDLAGMLTLHGMRAILVRDKASPAQLAEWAQSAPHRFKRPTRRSVVRFIDGASRASRAQVRHFGSADFYQRAIASIRSLPFVQQRPLSEIS